MQIIPLPLALPGKCIVCGASNNDDGRQYIDFGLEIDFYGVVYFCTHCMSETAVAIGYRSPSLFAVIEEENIEFAGKLSELSAENVKLRVALSQLDFLGTHGAIVDFDPGIEEPADTKRSDDSESIKPSDEPGRTNVSKARKLKSTEYDPDELEI